VKDFLKIYILFAPDSKESSRIAELIASHFDGIGMERDGVAFRVPVRIRSEPWDIGGVLPRPIDLNDAVHNAIIFLHDDYTYEVVNEWDRFISDLRSQIQARANLDVYIPFGSPSGEPTLPSDAPLHTQYARRYAWANALPDADARDARLLLHLTFKIREHFRTLQGITNDEPLFVSHAKADGDLTAKFIVDYVNDTGNDVPLETFYDAMELSPGDDFEAVFEANIGRGTLLAIISDTYDSRPWCIFELTTAKRANRPVLLADVGKVRVSRTYPYGANLPKIRVVPNGLSKTWIEQLLVQALSEGLRCDLFNLQAARLLTAAGITDVLVLPRPPELFDVIDRSVVASKIVYPDPPLGILEFEIINKALSRLAHAPSLLTLSEVK